MVIGRAAPVTPRYCANPLPWSPATAKPKTSTSLPLNVNEFCSTFRILFNSAAYMSKVFKYYLPYITIAAMGAYLIVFSIAALDYPGGSTNIPDYIGYSFFHNFLCDVMNPVTQTGVLNHARPLAIVSHLILSFTMISFFYLLPEIFSVKNRNTKLTRGFGMLTMFVFIFMYTEHHDSIVTATAVLGTIALIPFFIELANYPNLGLKNLARICFGLSLIVFLIFVSKIGFYYLPFIQKMAFVLDASWVIWVSLIVIKKNRLLAEKIMVK